MPTNNPSEDDFVAAQALLNKAHYDYSGRSFLLLRDEFGEEFPAIHGGDWQSIFGTAVVGTVLYLLAGELDEYPWNRLFEAVRRVYGEQPGANLANEFARTIRRHADRRTEFYLGNRILEFLELSGTSDTARLSQSTRKLLSERFGEEAFANAKKFLLICEFY